MSVEIRALLTVLTALHGQARTAWKTAAVRDGGYSTEAVVATAVLAAGALAVIGIIIARVTNKANSLDLG